jgi:hypothetical protein
MRKYLLRKIDETWWTKQNKKIMKKWKKWKVKWDNNWTLKRNQMKNSKTKETIITDGEAKNDKIRWLRREKWKLA